LLACRAYVLVAGRVFKGLEARAITMVARSWLHKTKQR
jgi:hypothetical protein